MALAVMVMFAVAVTFAVTAVAFTITTMTSAVATATTTAATTALMECVILFVGEFDEVKHLACKTECQTSQWVVEVNLYLII